MNSDSQPPHWRSRILRIALIGPLFPLLAWGCALGAWLSTLLTLVLVVVLARGRSWHAGLLSAALIASIVVAGIVETLYAIDQVGERSRQGELDLRDQVAVYGFNLVFGTAAVAAGFPAFGAETLALAIPFSLDGACPADRLKRYGDHLPRAYPGHSPRLRRWSSDLPMRSPRMRAVVATWAESLPADASEDSRKELGPHGPFTWPSSAYIAEGEANGVPIALNTPTTQMTGVAVRLEGRWRLDLSVDLALAYPSRATLQLGPFGLEEGMFHDARGLLHPYCLEYEWSVWSDDPSIFETEPIRGPLERGTTWILREAGAAYR